MVYSGWSLQLIGSKRLVSAGSIIHFLVVLKLKNTAEDERLESLPGAKLSAVQWDPDRACLPGTRKQLLEDIINWVHNPESEQIMWLSGAAGTGKSSIANSVAQHLDSLGRLGASFHFDRAVATLDTPGHLFGNLCHQLACFDDQLRTAVLSAMHRGCGGGMSCRIQARKLLVEPLQDAEIIGPVIIVIDALDESGDDDETSKTSRETLVNAIATEFPRLPKSIKVLITSRDEGSISRCMTQCGSCWHKDIADVNGTEEDIYSFVQYRMGQICKSHTYLVNGWPGLIKERALAQYADGLFIWAGVACTFIQSGDPDVQLNELLKDGGRDTAEAKLDHLFIDVIGHSLHADDAIQVNNWHYIVDSIVALKTPLTIQAMDSLLGLSAGHPSHTLIDGRQIKLSTAYTIISSLRPILRIDPGIKKVVQLLHKSVFDYLTSRAKIPILVNVTAQNSILAMRCLEIMNDNLHHDMCNISNISLLDSEVDGLSASIGDHISEALSYAACCFAEHLNAALIEHEALINKLHKFITQHLLNWIEIMGLLGKLHEAEVCLANLFTWMKVGKSIYDLYITKELIVY